MELERCVQTLTLEVHRVALYTVHSSRACGGVAVTRQGSYEAALEALRRDRKRQIAWAGTPRCYQGFPTNALLMIHNTSLWGM